MPDVEFAFDLQRAFIDKESGKKCVVGVCSDDLPDLQKERVSNGLIERWVDQCDGGLDLLDNHRSTFPFGKTNNGTMVTGPDGETQLQITVELDDKFPQSEVLYSEIKAGACKKQMSIGGAINLENPDCVSYERTKSGDVIRVLHDVTLDHVATTRNSHAANPRTGFSAAIVKALEDSGFEFPEEPALVASDEEVLAEVLEDLRSEFGDDMEKESSEKFFGDDFQTTADSFDGHRHFVSVDPVGNGMTRIAGSPPHAHVIRSWKIVDVQLTPQYTSKHAGKIPSEASSKGHREEGLVEKPFSGPNDKRLPSNVKRRSERHKDAW